MNTNEIYGCAYKEVIIILSFLSDADWNKIPKDKKDFYFNNMNKDYKFVIDTKKSFEEQKILNQTKAILANIYKEYLANEEEKKEIFLIEQKEFNQLEEEKRKKYNPDDIFKRVENKELNNHVEINLPIEIKKMRFYEKIFNYIKDIFFGGRYEK